MRYILPSTDPEVVGANIAVFFKYYLWAPHALLGLVSKAPRGESCLVNMNFCVYGHIETPLFCGNL